MDIEGYVVLHTNRYSVPLAWIGRRVEVRETKDKIEIRRRRKVQTASAVLCYSRMLFFQCYPTFQRFDCKVFLTDALRYMGGAAREAYISSNRSWALMN